MISSFDFSLVREIEGMNDYDTRNKLDLFRSTLLTKTEYVC